MARVLGTLLVFLLTAAAARAATLRVEQDGSTAFTAIQDAVDASAPGDTILVGPGRYEELHPFQFPAITVQTVVGIEVGPLTIMGTDADLVVVGPETPDIQGFGPQGFSIQVGADGVVLKNMTIENLFDGVLAGAHVTAEGCTFRGGEHGVALQSQGGAEFRDCVFFGGARGIISFNPTTDVLIERCQFLENETGVSLQGSTTNGILRNCDFVQCFSGVSMSQSTAEITSCFFEEVFSASLAMNLRASVTLSQSVLRGGLRSIVANTKSHLVGSGNIICGSQDEALCFEDDSTLQMSDSSIQTAGQWAVRVDDYNEDFFSLDLRNNYWGTSDPDSIATLIFDGNDDPTTNATVEFVPFLESPVPVRTTTVGGLKRLFSGNE